MKILYFVKGRPTPEELSEAERAGALVRNGEAWHDRDAFEPCDLVMGKPENVPVPYRPLLESRSKTAKRSGKNAADR